MRFWLQLFSIFFMSLFITYNIYAQSGKIAGQILNPDTKEPVIGANIIIEGTTLGAASDLNGDYTILNVSPGTYVVKASAIGFRTEEVRNVQVSIDLTTRLDFNLKESAVQIADVVVTAQKPLIQKDLTSSTAIVDSKEIQTMPVTSFQDILQLQAGIVKDKDGTMHFRGGRGGEVSYWIDGVPVTDSYNGSTVVDVNKNSIQEMQVVTGAFNAEYGQAMSGIVNIATKTGGNNIHGLLTAYAGSYATQHSDIFNGLQSIKPGSIQWYEGSLNGPIIKDKLYYYTDARYYYTGGYLYGQRKFNTWDISNTQDANSANWTIQQTGDNKSVSMAPFMEAYIQGKLTYKISPQFRISYDYIMDNSRAKDYDFTYKYNPDGMLSVFNKGYLNTLTVTHTLNSSTYYNLGISYFFKDQRKYMDQNAFSLSDLFTTDNPFNQQYVHTKLLNAPEATFYTGGTNMFHGIRNTGTIVAKFDITSQLTPNHELKAGLLFDQYNLFLHNINLKMSDADNNRDPLVDKKPFLTGPVVIPSIESPDNLEYMHRPQQFSAYVQDKMEFKSLIVNLGVRLDWFNPDGQILADPSDPNVYSPVRPENQDSVVAPGGTHAEAVAKRMTYWYKKASKKWQLSPRVGVSFPITDRGVVHFSYGLFFQMPSFERLYENPGYKLLLAGNTNLGIIGNPDLEPEQTTSGELGLQQQLTDDISLDVTGFFRDIRNLAGTLNELQYVFGGTAIYSQYVNTDFGFVRGLVLSIDKRFSGGLSATLDYTFQIAKGDASDPAAAYNLRNQGVQPETQLIPLDWDQRHTLNASLSYINNVADWGGTLIFRFGSGNPYTPRQVSQNVGELVYNSGLKPSTYNLDLNLFKDFNISSTKITLFLRVNNLLDTKNAVDVFTDTGLPDYSLDEQQDLRINPSQRVATVQDWYTKPYYYSEPRRVEIGTTITF